MIKKYFHIIKLLLFGFITVFLMFFVFKNTDLTVLIDSIINANKWYIALAILFSCASFISRAYRWKLLIRSLGKDISTLNSLSAVFIGYLANMAIPRMGEVTRCGILSKKENVKFESLLGTVISERVVDLISLIILFIFLVILKINFFGQFLYNSTIAPLSEKINSLSYTTLIVILSIAAILLAIIIYIFRKKNSHRLIQKFKNFIHGIQLGIKSIYKLQDKKAFIFHTIFIWIMYWAMTYTFFFSIEATSNLSAIDGLFILVVGGLGMVAPVQSGFGVFHGLVASALTLYNIKFETDGLTYATINHESQVLFIIIAGSLSLLYLFFNKSKNQEQQ